MIADSHLSSPGAGEPPRKAKCQGYRINSPLDGLYVAGICKPPDVDYSSIRWGTVKIRAVYREMPRRTPRPAVPMAESRGMVWLPWWTNGQEHGIRTHKFDPKTGAVREIEDMKIRPKKKSKAISTRQWEQGRRA